MATENSFKTLTHFCYTLYLFTASDFKTVILPKTILGTFNALSGPVLSSCPTMPTSVILIRAPLVFFWAWINLLPFNINNQRQPEAILEDRANKAWRPMPSGRISPNAAFKLMATAYCVTFSISWYLGAFLPCLTIICLGIAYNDLGGSDASCLVRNLLNAGLYLAFATGATIVAGGGGYTLAPVAWKWLGVIGLTVFTTVHMQDIPDQGGDRARGRNTVPLVIGDGPARWTVMGMMSFCSLWLPIFWNLNFWGFPMILVGIGAIVIWRVFTKRLVDEDKVTWRLWNLWISSAYLLPFIKSLDMT